jgi:hypothetical protein
VRFVMVMTEAEAVTMVSGVVIADHLIRKERLRECVCTVKMKRRKAKDAHGAVAQQERGASSQVRSHIWHKVDSPGGRCKEVDAAVPVREGTRDSA